MINDIPVIALIPARGGSKGLHRKNLTKILGKSLVEIAIKSAVDAKKIDYVYLSSDDKEILEVGQSLRVELINRPTVFASDFASAGDVVNHFFNHIPLSLCAMDPYLIYLQPTSPLRTSSHIDNALRQVEKVGNSALVSVVELTKSAYKSFGINKDGLLQSLYNETLSNARRQDLPKTYIPNGAIYIFRLSDFRAKNGFPSNGSIPFIMSEIDSVDIDSEEDILIAQKHMRMKNG